MSSRMVGKVLPFRIDQASSTGFSQPLAADRCTGVAHFCTRAHAAPFVFPMAELQGLRLGRCRGPAPTGIACGTASEQAETGGRPHTVGCNREFLSRMVNQRPVQGSHYLGWAHCDAWFAGG